MLRGHMLSRAGVLTTATLVLRSQHRGISFMSTRRLLDASDAKPPSGTPPTGEVGAPKPPTDNAAGDAADGKRAEHRGRRESRGERHGDRGDHDDRGGRDFGGPWERRHEEWAKNYEAWAKRMHHDGWENHRWGREWPSRRWDNDWCRGRHGHRGGFLCRVFSFCVGVFVLVWMARVTMWAFGFCPFANGRGGEWGPVRGEHEQDCCHGRPWGGGPWGGRHFGRHSVPWWAPLSSSACYLLVTSVLPETEVERLRSEYTKAASTNSRLTFEDFIAKQYPHILDGRQSSQALAVSTIETCLKGADAREVARTVRGATWRTHDPRDATDGVVVALRRDFPFAAKS